MEELLVFVLVLLFVIFVSITLFTIFVVSSLATSIISIPYGIWFMSGVLRKTLAEAHWLARRQEESTTPIPVYLVPFIEEQPAYLIYWYSRGWRAMGLLFPRVREELEIEIKKWFGRARKNIDIEDFDQALRTSAAVGLLVGTVSYFLVLIIIFLLFSFVQTSILIMGIIITSVIMTLLWVGNRLYSIYYKLYFRCPQCHRQMSIPVHVCPTCGEHHTRLWPNAYGVFRHECKGKLRSGVCHEQLPTMKLWGRNHLERRCVHCGYVLEGQGTNIHIPVVGGPSVGKTYYIVSATRQLIEDYAHHYPLKITFPDSVHQEDYNNKVALLEQNKQLPKTPTEANSNTTAYNLEIALPRRREPSLIYIYDASGEYFTELDQARRQIYFKYAHGILFLLDPFSIPSVRQKYEAQLGGTPYIAPAMDNVEHIYARMHETLAAIQGTPNQKFRVPLAVVVTKADAFDLEECIGTLAAKRFMAENKDIRLEQDAIHIIVHDFLIEHKMGNLVRDIQNTFLRYRFFSTSVIHSESFQYKPLRVLDPLLWLMGNLDVIPEVRQERVHYIDQHDREAADQIKNKLAAFRYYVWDSLRPR